MIARKPGSELPPIVTAQSLCSLAAILSAWLILRGAAYPTLRLVGAAAEIALMGASLWLYARLARRTMSRKAWRRLAIAWKILIAIYLAFFVICAVGLACFFLLPHARR